MEPTIIMIVTTDLLYVSMIEVLPCYGRHVFVIGRPRLGSVVIHPRWVIDKNKFMKLEAPEYG